MPDAGRLFGVDGRAGRLAGVDGRASLAGLGAAGLVAAAIVLGSRGLRDYDTALAAYTLGSLLAAFCVSYRTALWLRRPAARLYARRGLELLLRGRGHASYAAHRGLVDVAAQRFVARRSRARWLAHLCLSWGTMLAAAVTFPLVFGWVHFETRVDDPRVYEVVALGARVLAFDVDSPVRHVLFNLLNASGVMVLFGAAYFLQRRLADPGMRARQQIVHDLLPLLLLLAIAVTGLMLTASAKLMDGYGYGAVAALHALAVVGTLLYLPFGKLFHAVQRPLHVAVGLARRADAETPAVRCAACAAAFAGAGQLAHLKVVLAEVGLDWPLPSAAADRGARHYSDVCPACRRRLLGFAQGVAMGRG